MRGAVAIQRAGVVGAGTMGSGIAQVAAVAGFPVRLYDVGPAILDRALKAIAASVQKGVERGKVSPERAAQALKAVEPTTDLDAFADVDFVIEAVPEVIALKKETFARLDKICPAGAVLATNTSSLSVTELGAATGRADRVGGMHFFNPAPIMALVEVIRGQETSEATMATILEAARAFGKTPVVAKDSPAFIVNRVARAFTSEALRLLGEDAASVEEIDRIMKLGGGFRMGPFELMDLVGIDVNFAVHQSVYEAFFYEPRFRPHPIQRMMVQAGRLGRKAGRGFYDYRQGQRA